MNTGPIGFNGLNSADVYEKGNPLPIGTFDLEIQKCLAKRTRKGDAFIVEFLVVNSYQNPNVQNGEKRTWFQKMSDTNVAFPAIKEFLIAALGFKDKKTADATIQGQYEAILTEAVNADGLKGTKVHVDTFQKKTTKNTDFTVHAWAPYAAKAA